MVQTLEAVFDGVAFYPDVPLNLEAGTRVRIVVEPILPHVVQPPKSFLQTARSLQLEGPSDWSVNLDHYLYGENSTENG
jgi:hypothetical protein